MKYENMPARGGKKIVIANWKMNLSVQKALVFIKNLPKTKNEIVIAAPYTFLSGIAQLRNKKIKLAAQNVSQFTEGAYTGEISAKMLKESGCTHCLVGHSERRIYFQENDKMVNRKIINLLSSNIKPIVCVGENALERKKNLTKKIINNQLRLALTGIKDPKNIIIAYEPVWAISTFQKGKNIKSAGIFDIIEVHNYIKRALADIYKNKAKQIRVIYGGTVNPKNSQQILGLKEVDGALVGGASLKVSSFNAIIRSI